MFSCLTTITFMACIIQKPNKQSTHVSALSFHIYKALRGKLSAGAFLLGRAAPPAERTVQIYIKPVYINLLDVSKLK